MKGQWGKVVGYVLGVAIISAAITLLPPLLGGGVGWLPELVSEEGASIDALFWGLLWLSIVIFALVGGVIVYSMVHFRAAPGDLSDGEHIHGNARMEIAWIVVPTIIVCVIGVLSYVVMKDNEVGLFDEDARNDPGAATMIVDVRGFSFGWAFRYEDMDGKPLASDEFAEPGSELVLPLDVVVKYEVMSCSGIEAIGREREQTVRELAAHGHEFELAEIEPGICEREWNLTTEEDIAQAREDGEKYYRIKHELQDGKDISAEDQAFWDEQPRFHGDVQTSDVNHAFWVPEARLKIDAISGLRTYVQWTADEITGPDDHFQVVCAELCGSGHNGMRTDMCVVDQGTFDWWLTLDNEERREATCVNLRLMTCVDPIGDGEHAEVLEQVATLSKEDPEASCEDVEEQAA